MPALVSTPWDGLRRIDGRPRQSTAAQRLDPRGDRLFGPMQSGEEDAVLAIDGIGDDLAVLQLQVDRCLDDLRLHLQ